MNGRFAPSPTSELHLGNLRTALLAWFYARSAGEGFLVRNEDLDSTRVAAASGVAERQLADLAALGIDWDGEVVNQSDRFSLYRDASVRLETYECFCTRKEIAAASSAPHGELRPYAGTCRNLTEKEKADLRRRRPASIRVHANSACFTVADRFFGEITAEVDDFVLFRSDGNPSYNLAVVVDDGLQGVTQVCRGRDLLESSPRQAWLATQLGFPVPEYLHVGLVMKDGVRLAKRHGDISLRDISVTGMRRIINESLGLPEDLSPIDWLNESTAQLLNSSSITADWNTTDHESSQRS